MEFIFNTVFKSWKTTVTAVVAFLVWTAGQFGVLVPQDVATGAIAVAVFLIGLLSKDADASHRGV